MDDIEKIKNQVDAFKSKRLRMGDDFHYDKGTELHKERIRLEFGICRKIRELKSREANILFNMGRLSSNDLVEVFKLRNERNELIRIQEDLMEDSNGTNNDWI